MDVEMDTTETRDNVEVDDVDSDLEELEGDIAKLDESVRRFLVSQNGGTEPSAEPSAVPATRGGAFRGRGGHRGPRKAVKPRGDINARLAKVNQAFLSGDYTTALELASEVVRINAETHQAWTTLASIFAEIGEVSKALSAMVYAAHLRPKHVEGWLQCASYATTHVENGDDGNLQTARLCYSAALRADSKNIKARLGKATICHEQGHLGAAIADYKYYLNKYPHDLEIVRKLAEACIDNRHNEAAIPSATSAYRRYFEIEINQGFSQPVETTCYDIGIYVELFASVGRFDEAIHEIKQLARWVVGRSSENFWDEWQEDDREWDEGDERRITVPGFSSTSAGQSAHGPALPLDLRARLAAYRLGLGSTQEALNHLSWLDPLEAHTRNFIYEFPFLIFDVASELLRHSQHELAIQYLEILRSAPGQPDPSTLLELGRCYLARGDSPTAEECFLLAIDIDDDCIEPRIELANMYEKAQEDEEALILAAEAMALQERENGERQASPGVSAESSRRPRGPNKQRINKPSAEKVRKTVLPKRYRPKRLANPDKRRQDEQAHAIRLSRQYQAVCSLKQQLRDGNEDLVDSWMQSSRELIDDFRSLKKFYSWDKYLLFLGPRTNLSGPSSAAPESELGQMYERLTRIANLAPQAEPDSQDHESRLNSSHQGISFDQWLGLFLDYAVGLAMTGRREEAYQVCAAARDSNAFQSPDHNFAIHVTWSVCAVYTCDEERCITLARYLMKDGVTSDSSRMFALLACLCQSPISWYTSGPTQKYIMRQIKAMDIKQGAVFTRGSDDAKALNTARPEDVELDVPLLMLYGHILFSSTSYTYALAYFLRAYALDPQNPMVNLSLGLAYVHNGLKRQSMNRQFIILQGQVFMSQYAELAMASGNDGSIAEVYYNVGRLFHLLGMVAMALKYYAMADAKMDERSGTSNLALLSRANQVMSLLSVGNRVEALALVNSGLVL